MKCGPFFKAGGIRMDYNHLSNDMLYEMAKLRVPEMPIIKVDDSNRKVVIAVLTVIERIVQRRELR
jgi:hypothetical protein